MNIYYSFLESPHTNGGGVYNDTTALHYFFPFFSAHLTIYKYHQKVHKHVSGYWNKYIKIQFTAR
jgi:hypothetical protein